MVTLNNQMSGSSDNQTGQMTIVLTEAVDFRIGSEMMDGLDWSDGLGDSDASILAALKEANPNVKFDNGRIPAGTRLVIPEIEGLSRADWFETERNRPVLGFGGTRAGGRLFGDARLEGTEGTDFQTINTAEFTSEQLRDLFDRYTYTAQADAFAAYNGIAMSTLEDVLNGERELSSLGATVRIPLRDPFKGGRIEYDDRSFLPSAASEEQRGSGPAENTNNTVATAGSMVAEVPTEHQAAVIAVLEASMERGPYGRANRGGRPRSEAYIPLERIEGYASLKENVPNLDAIIAQHRADGGTTLAGRENTTVTDREELRSEASADDVAPTADDNALVARVATGENMGIGAHSRGFDRADVARIQQVLLTGGHYKETPEGINEVDGKYGRRTFNAVRELQRKYGLEDDGVVGPDTIAALQIEEAQQALAAGTQLTPEQRAALGNELADIAGLENMPITDKLKDEVRGLLTGIEAVEGLADERNISTSLPDIRDKAGLGPTA